MATWAKEAESIRGSSSNKELRQSGGREEAALTAHEPDALCGDDGCGELDVERILALPAHAVPQPAKLQHVLA